GDLTDEAVQETWLTALRRIRTFDPRRAPFATWLRGIAANVLRNQLRQRARRARQVPLNGEYAGRGAAGDQRDRAEASARALARSPGRWEAFRGPKYLDQKGGGETAAAWGEPPRAVKPLLPRAREAFRAA